MSTKEKPQSGWVYTKLYRQSIPPLRGLLEQIIREGSIIRVLSSEIVLRKPCISFRLFDLLGNFQAWPT